MCNLSPQSATHTQDINLNNSIELFWLRKYQTWTKKWIHEKNDNEEKGNCCHFSSTVINPYQHQISIAHWQRTQQQIERSAERNRVYIITWNWSTDASFKKKLHPNFFDFESIEFGQKNWSVEWTENEENGNNLWIKSKIINVYIITVYIITWNWSTDASFKKKLLPNFFDLKVSNLGRKTELLNEVKTKRTGTIYE